MEWFDSIYNDLVSNGLVDVNILYATAGFMLLVFFIQLGYYLGTYGKIPRFRNNRGIRSNIPSEPVSVIVVIRENSYYYIENYLPRLLTQEYAEFEVVAVDCSYDEEIERMLEEMAGLYPNLRITQIKAQQGVEHGVKLALTVGIKAAAYENLIFTTVDSFPDSEKWLSLMAKGFIGGEVVIGYCGIEPKRGFVNGWMRCSRLMTSVRYLAAAIDNKPYRGISHNLGYTKSLYFDNKGFNYLNMNTGDDDLFVQKISQNKSVSVVMNFRATTRQIQYGGLGWWSSMCRSYSYAYRYYPFGVKLKTGMELWTRFLFFASVAALLVLLPGVWKAVPGFFLLLRLAIVESGMYRICRRLGEGKLIRHYVLYDLVSPFTELCLAIIRNLRPNKSIWR